MRLLVLFLVLVVTCTINVCDAAPAANGAITVRMLSYFATWAARVKSGLTAPGAELSPTDDFNAKQNNASCAGLAAAIYESNQAGGIQGRYINLTIGDLGAETSTTLATQAVVTDNVDVVALSREDVSLEIDNLIASGAGGSDTMLLSPHRAGLPALQKSAYSIFLDQSMESLVIGLVEYALSSSMRCRKFAIVTYDEVAVRAAMEDVRAKLESLSFPAPDLLIAPIRIETNTSTIAQAFIASVLNVTFDVPANERAQCIVLGVHAELATLAINAIATHPNYDAHNTYCLVTFHGVPGAPFQVWNSTTSRFDTAAFANTYAALSSPSPNDDTFLFTQRAVAAVAALHASGTYDLTTLDDWSFRNPHWMRGYAVGRLLIEAMQRTHAYPTRSVLFEAIFHTKLFVIDDMTLGPLSNGCVGHQSNATVLCECNVAQRTVNVDHVNGSTGLLMSIHHASAINSDQLELSTFTVPATECAKQATTAIAPGNVVMTLHDLSVPDPRLERVQTQLYRGQRAKFAEAGSKDVVIDYHLDQDATEALTREQVASLSDRFRMSILTVPVINNESALSSAPKLPFLSIAPMVRVDYLDEDPPLPPSYEQWNTRHVAFFPVLADFIFSAAEYAVKTLHINDASRMLSVTESSRLSVIARRTTDHFQLGDAPIVQLLQATDPHARSQNMNATEVDNYAAAQVLGLQGRVTALAGGSGGTTSVVVLVASRSAAVLRAAQQLAALVPLSVSVVLCASEFVVEEALLPATSLTSNALFASGMPFWTTNGNDATGDRTGLTASPGEAYGALLGDLVQRLSNERVGANVVDEWERALYRGRMLTVLLSTHVGPFDDKACAVSAMPSSKNYEAYVEYDSHSGRVDDYVAADIAQTTPGFATAAARAKSAATTVASIAKRDASGNMSEPLVRFTSAQATGRYYRPPGACQCTKGLSEFYIRRLDEWAGVVQGNTQNVTRQLLHSTYLAQCGVAYSRLVIHPDYKRIYIALCVEAFLCMALMAVLSYFFLRKAGRDLTFAPQDPDKPFAIIFTDIQSSTTHWARCPEHMGAAVDAHNDILRTLLPLYEGFEIKVIGDALMCAFCDPEKAVAFALAAQIELYNDEWNGTDVFDQTYRELMLDSAPSTHEPYLRFADFNSFDSDDDENAVVDDKEGTVSAVGSPSSNSVATTNMSAQSPVANKGLVTPGADASTPPPSGMSAHTTTDASNASTLPSARNQHHNIKKKKNTKKKNLPTYGKLWHGLRVRIGINFGHGNIKYEETTAGFDYYGTICNTAARVESVGHGGQVLISEAVYNALTEERTKPFPVKNAIVEDLGPQPLRGLEEPIRLFQVLPTRFKRRLFPPLRVEVAAKVDEDEEDDVDDFSDDGSRGALLKGRRDSDTRSMTSNPRSEGQGSVFTGRGGLHRDSTADSGGTSSDGSSKALTPESLAVALAQRGHGNATDPSLLMLIFSSLQTAFSTSRPAPRERAIGTLALTWRIDVQDQDSAVRRYVKVLGQYTVLLMLVAVKVQTMLGTQHRARMRQHRRALANHKQQHGGSNGPQGVLVLSPGARSGKSPAPTALNSATDIMAASTPQNHSLPLSHDASPRGDAPLTDAWSARYFETGAQKSNHNDKQAYATTQVEFFAAPPAMSRQPEQHEQQ